MVMGLSKEAANFSIICLDADREWLSILSRELKSIGMRNVQTVTDPKMALGHLQHSDIDLVVIDHNLKFAKFLRHSKASPNREVPIIMMTTQVRPEDIFAMRDAGVNEIAVKPCSINQLLQRIEAIASNPRRFVWSDEFAGPDRRRKEGQFSGPERRDAED